MTTISIWERSKIIVTGMTLFCMALIACSRQPVYPPPAVLGSDAFVDVSRLTPDVPRFFTYQYQGRNISFFVLKLEGKVLSFLDACASCYQHKRGYRYDHDVVTCRYCSMRFPLHRLEKGLGGCYPIRVDGRLENGNYLISLARLEAAAGKF